jgi:Flp pilus assembly protein TadD
MWKSATLALMALAVLGCATPEQRQSATPEQGQGATPEQRQSATPEQRQGATPQQRPSATPEQRQKRIAADQERIAAHMQRDLAPVCTSAGLTPGTDDHSHCIISLYQQELKRKAAITTSPKPERP